MNIFKTHPSGLSSAWRWRRLEALPCGLRSAQEKRLEEPLLRPLAAAPPWPAIALSSGGLSPRALPTWHPRDAAAAQPLFNPSQCVLERSLCPWERSTPRGGQRPTAACRMPFVPPRLPCFVSLGRRSWAPPESVRSLARQGAVGG